MAPRFFFAFVGCRRQYSQLACSMFLGSFLRQQRGLRSVEFASSRILLLRPHPRLTTARPTLKTATAATMAAATARAVPATTIKDFVSHNGCNKFLRTVMCVCVCCCFRCGGRAQNGTTEQGTPATKNGAHGTNGPFSPANVQVPDLCHSNLEVPDPCLPRTWKCWTVGSSAPC